MAADRIDEVPVVIAGPEAGRPGRGDHPGQERRPVAAGGAQPGPVAPAARHLGQHPDHGAVAVLGPGGRDPGRAARPQLHRRLGGRDARLAPQRRGAARFRRPRPGRGGQPDHARRRAPGPHRAGAAAPPASPRADRVRFGTELAALDQDAGGVTVVLQERPECAVRTVRAGYVVGADGATPFVRRLGIPMVGPRPPERAGHGAVRGAAGRGRRRPPHPASTSSSTRRRPASWSPARRRRPLCTGGNRTPAGNGWRTTPTPAWPASSAPPPAPATCRSGSWPRGAFSFAAQVADRYRSRPPFLVGDAAQRMTPRGRDGHEHRRGRGPRPRLENRLGPGLGRPGPARHLRGRMAPHQRSAGAARSPGRPQTRRRRDPGRRPQRPPPPRLPGPRRPGRGPPESSAMPLDHQTCWVPASSSPAPTPPLDHRHGQPGPPFPLTVHILGLATATALQLAGDGAVLVRPDAQVVTRGQPPRPTRPVALRLRQDVGTAAVGPDVVPGALDAALRVEEEGGRRRPRRCGRSGSSRPRR